MADYYPLIAKAVAGLDKSTGEARRALYERARTALVGQLRNVTPALSESDITRERLALEEAIRKVEAESARRARYEPPSRPEARVEARVPPRPAARPPQAEPAGPAPSGEARPPGAGGERPEVARPDPAGPSSTTAADLRRRSLRDRPVFERASLADEGLRGFRDVVAETENLGEATAQAGRTAREAFAAVPAPSAEFERIEPHVEPEGLRGPPRRPGPAREPEAVRPRDYDLPAEPQVRDFDAPDARLRVPAGPDIGRMPPRDGMPRTDARGIDAMAPAEFTGDDFSPYTERMRPDAAYEEERQSRRAYGGEADGEVAVARRRWPSGQFALFGVLVLLVLVAGGFVAWRWQPIKAAVVGLTSSLWSSSAPTPQREAQPSRPKFSDRVGDARSGQQGAPAAAVAQKVVLYEEDPTDPAGKQYVGSAVWRSETVSPGPGQAPEIAVRADIEIPERKIAMKWSLRRNSDKALPASHTIEIMFTLPADFSHGGIQNIPGILMKQSEQTRGVPLAGLAVKVTTNFFLIGLSSVESDMQRNTQLLKERAWFDVPIVYNDGRRAILAVEKGNPGERTFNEAFTAWGQK